MAAKGKASDHDNACTSGDVCKAGACHSGTNTCPCSSDADCAGKHDGNLCNGTLYCNPVGGPGDPCPTVYNPGGDPAACAAVPVALGQRVGLGLGQPGSAAGTSERRRTHEIVDVPLLNGDLGSLVTRLLPVHQRLHSDGAADCDWAGTSTADAAGVPGFAAAFDAGNKQAMACLMAPQTTLIRDEMTAMAWLRPTLVGGKRDAVALSGKGAASSLVEFIAVHDGAQKLGIRLAGVSSGKSVVELTSAPVGRRLVDRRRVGSDRSGDGHLARRQGRPPRHRRERTPRQQPRRLRPDQRRREPGLPLRAALVEPPPAAPTASPESP